MMNPNQEKDKDGKPNQNQDQQEQTSRNPRPNPRSDELDSWSRRWRMTYLNCLAFGTPLEPPILSPPYSSPRLRFPFPLDDDVVYGPGFPTERTFGRGLGEDILLDPEWENIGYTLRRREDANGQYGSVHKFESYNVCGRSFYEYAVSQLSQESKPEGHESGGEQPEVGGPSSSRTLFNLIEVDPEEEEEENELQETIPEASGDEPQPKAKPSQHD